MDKATEAAFEAAKAKVEAGTLLPLVRGLACTDPREYVLVDPKSDGEAEFRALGFVAPAELDAAKAKPELPPIPENFADLPWHELRSLALKYGAPMNVGKEDAIGILAKARAVQPA